MQVDSYINCCGIREISSLSYYRGPKAAMIGFCDQVYSRLLGNPPHTYMSNDNSNFRYAVFSQAGARGAYGQRFAAYITENNLGEVIETGRHVNPNSGNQLKVFVWTVDHDAVKLWMKEVKDKDAKAAAKKASKKDESSGPQAPGRQD